MLCLGAYLTVELCVLYVWSSAGQVFSLQGPADGASTLPVTAAAMVNLYLCLMAWRSFRSRTPLRPAWTLIALTAAAQGVPCMLAQLLGPAGMPAGLRISVAILAGPVRFTLLAVALLSALRILRRFGFWVRPTAFDWAVCGVAGLFAVCRFVEAGWASGTAPISAEAWTSLASHVLLCILFLEAALLRQSAVRMGHGPIARCWTTFAHAIFLTGLSELALWMAPHYTHAVPPAMIQSLLQFVAVAIFALAPAHQLAAQHLATKPAEAPRSGWATSVPATAQTPQ
ncbi:MAG TPA: hypothetical protein VHW09_31600 [Bryobacteraceae bacterium]|nr:hypothetical protein [Bryobacteraceae bacterium]